MHRLALILAFLAAPLAAQDNPVLKARDEVQIATNLNEFGIKPEAAPRADCGTGEEEC